MKKGCFSPLKKGENTRRINRLAAGRDIVFGKKDISDAYTLDGLLEGMKTIE